MFSNHILWGSSLIFVNIIALIIMLSSGELIGDLKGNIIHDYNYIYISLFSVTVTYFILIFVIFPTFRKINFKTYKYNENKISFRISWFILISQILFIVFNLIYGVNVAGSGTKSSTSFLSLIWVFVPVDLLFIIYYAYYRKDSLFKVNLCIAIISSLLRGRADIFLLIVFFEMSIYIRRHGLPIIKLLFLTVLVILLYPFITMFKFASRVFFGEGGGGDFNFLIQLNNEINSNGYFNLIYVGIEHLIGRLQLISISSEIIRLRFILSEMYYNNEFFPFWKEGLHGIIWDSLFNNDRNIPLGIAFTKIGNFSWDFNVGDWISNPGLSSWFSIAPFHSIQFILYILVLCFLCFLFSRLIGNSELRDDMILYSWLFFLIPSWLNTFFIFIYSLFLFLCIKVLFNIVPSFKVR